jgi:hypothetical protein
MAKTFKYKINDYIHALPRTISIGRLQKVLQNEHGISSDTFYRDRAIKSDDEFSIPSDRMDVYAGVFGCKVDDLKNFTTKKIKPLHERKLSSGEKSIIKKAKLSK